MMRLTELPIIWRCYATAPVRPCGQRAQRDHSHVALLLIDIDQFKPINAALGHSQGDQLLSTLSQSLPGGSARLRDAVPCRRRRVRRPAAGPAGG
ncbi:diguanylate cyclase domain-containing protein [Cupriavidus basilensis]